MTSMTYYHHDRCHENCSHGHIFECVIDKLHRDEQTDGENERHGDETERRQRAEVHVVAEAAVPHEKEKHRE